MDNQYIYIINFAAYVVLLYFLFKSKLPGKKIVILIVGLFIVSSFSTILFLNTPLYYTLSERIDDPSILALFYLYINFLIYLIPISKVEIKDVSKLPRYNYLVYFTIFLGFVSILPAIENTIRLLDFGVEDMAEAYQDSRGEDGIRDTRSQFSVLGRFLNGISSWFSYFTPALFFYVIKLKEKFYVIMLALIAFINPILPSFFVGARGALFHLFFTFILYYLIFKDVFSLKIRVLIKKIGLVVCILIAIFMVSMTIARSSNESDLALSQIYRYLGEGFVNFAETGWYINNHTWGYSIINGTGNTIMSEFSDFFEARDYLMLENITKIRMYVYYTVFGDYYLDFGMVGGIIFNYLLSILFWKSINNGFNRLSSIIILNMYARIGFNGIYCFAYMNYLEFVCFSIFILWILKRYEQRTFINNSNCIK